MKLLLIAALSIMGISTITGLYAANGHHHLMKVSTTCYINRDPMPNQGFYLIFKQVRLGQKTRVYVKSNSAGNFYIPSSYHGMKFRAYAINKQGIIAGCYSQRSPHARNNLSLRFVGVDCGAVKSCGYPPGN